MQPLVIRRSRRLLLAAVAAIAGCGGGGGDQPVLPSSIALSLSATSASAVQGTSSPVTATVSRANFGGDVSLTIEGLPAGVTASFAPATLSGTTASSVVTLAAGATATPGTTTISVRASGSGVTSQTSSLALTITAAVTPAYTLALSPAAATLTAGTNGTVSVTLARTNFTGDVALSAGGVPAGATVAFAPASTTGNSSAMTISTGTAAAGSYTITVTGTATGLAARTATLPLTINAPGAPNNVTFSFCSTALPIWVGYQDGTGDWKQATAGANNTYSFSIASKGGVAIVDSPTGNPAQSGYEAYIYYGSLTDLKGIGATNCVEAIPGPRTVNGSVAGLGSSTATIALAQSITDVPADGAFSLTGVQTGARDLLATLVSGTTGNATKIVVRRGLDPANGATLPVVDFAAAEAVAPVRYTLSFNGVTSGAPALVLSDFGTANTTSLPLSGEQFSANAASYLGYPNAVAGDLHQVLAEVLQGTSDYRGSFSFFAVPGTRDAGLGPLLSRPSFSSLGATPYPRLRAQFASQAEYGNLALALFAQQSGTNNDRVVQVLMTPGYLGSVPTTWDLAIPDLSGTPGFSNGWMLFTGRSTDVAGAAYGGNILFGTPIDGTIYTFAQSYSSTSTSAALASVQPGSGASPLRARQLRAQAARLMRFAQNRRTLRMR